MRRLSAGIGLLGYLLAAPAHSQSNPPPLRGRWALGISVGVSNFTAAAEAPSEDGETLRLVPYRPTMYGISLSRGRDRSRISLSLRYGRPGLGARGAVSDGLIVLPNADDLYVFTGAVSTRLLRLRGGPSLRPSVGLSLEHWDGGGPSKRTILGGQAGLALEVVLTRAFVGTLEGELGFTPASPYRKEDLTEGGKQRSPWRRSLAGGLSWRF